MSLGLSRSRVVTGVRDGCVPLMVLRVSTLVMGEDDPLSSVEYCDAESQLITRARARDGE